MEVINCKNCRRLFNYLGGTPLCPNCLKERDDKYQQVKQYIYDNPRAGIQQVSEDNDVSVQQLWSWVREERLQFAEGTISGLVCESCGKAIRSGRLCNECKGKMANALGGLYKKTPEVKKKADSSAKMRFLD